MYYSICPALIVPIPALIIPCPSISNLLANIFPITLAAHVPNNMPKILPFCSIVSFSIASLTLSVNIPDSERALTLFVITFFVLLKLLV